jgi:aspartyl-tRNA(Asn)/glutamyl-tRNA(Gln) amidotransferase subunit B
MGSQEYGTRTELKNLNSFRFIEAAIDAEIGRQMQILERGDSVQQCTLAYDPKTHRTHVLRLKEDADDYRYFPDPDLVPLLLSAEEIEGVQQQLPELPEQKCERFQSQYGLSEYDALQLTVTRSLADFFESTTRAHGEPKPVANWILRDVLQALNERDLEIDASPLEPESLAALIRLVDEGKTTPKSARGLLPELVERGGDAVALVEERGLTSVSDSGLIETAVLEVLEEHPDNVGLYRSGEAKVIHFLMGQVMRKTGGKASPAAVREILERELQK